MAYVVKTEE